MAGGDDYLIRINTQAARRHLRLYLRPLGNGTAASTTTRALIAREMCVAATTHTVKYKQAFRRIAIITRGGAGARFHQRPVEGPSTAQVPERRPVQAPSPPPAEGPRLAGLGASLPAAP